ncbi:MAG: hypothetical protein RLZZ129_2722, partial [Verrucomicrobiota bacterium]
MPADAWSDWQPLAGQPPLTAAVLAETLDGGQTFRWSCQPDGTWLGLWSDCVARLRLQPDGRLRWSAPAQLAARLKTALPAYLGGGRDFRALADTLPWRSDAHLARCLAAFPGLALPRQPFGETLLCFLCSATKQIVQIKQMVALLAERHGKVFAQTGDAVFHRLPTWAELAEIPEPALRACLLGFR